MNFSSKSDLFLVANFIFPFGSKKSAKFAEMVMKDEDILNSGEEILRALSGDGEERRFSDLSNWLEEEKRKIEKYGVSIVTIVDDEYPVLLKYISTPPIVLYCLGDVSLLKTRMVSIVGARKCNSYGANVSFDFSKSLAENGITIVSGLALGIDKRAHEGALEASGRTVAVLGSGVDIPYPSTNRKLYDRIVESGLIISEFPLNMKANRMTFPIRNRIVAGLSEVVIIVQAAQRSGTLITARLALDYGRELLAVPGDINLKLSEGTNKLIFDGATPAIGSEELLEYLGIKSKNGDTKIDTETKHGKMTPQEKRLLGFLEMSSYTIDELSRLSGMPVSKVNVLVIGLEADGIVRQESGRRVVLIR